MYGDFPTFQSGVYKLSSGSYLGGPSVTLVGCCELNGETYWKIKNISGCWHHRCEGHGLPVGCRPQCRNTEVKMSSPFRFIAKAI